jgi:hypothetical protein
MKRWRGPAHPGDFPTLGWQVLDWTFAYLPSPADESQPLVYTDEQARRILRWYEIDPDTGQFVYETLILEEAKGSGKSPFAGTLELVEFAGPCLFDGWDADGEPVAVPWGTGERPPPWNQIAAVSEDQTENTYGALYAMLTANEGKAASALGVDEGRTRLYLHGRPGRLEPVTASAGSREGQRTTKATLDETHLWLPTNGGVKLAKTLRRNVAKMGGRTVETTNAPVLGERSVAEQSSADTATPGTLHYCRRPKVEPDPGWSDAQLSEALSEAYGDAWWVDNERRVREIRKPTSDWGDTVRYWFNIRTPGSGRAVDPRRWDELAAPQEVKAGSYVALGFKHSHDATVLRGCTAEGYSFVVAQFLRPKGELDWTVPRAAVNEAVAGAFDTYKVGRMLCDPPQWRTEVEEWAAAYSDEVVLAFETSSSRRFAPAVDRWLTAIREGTHHHDADEATGAHVKAAHLRKVRTTDPDDDTRTLYVLIPGSEGGQIAGAIADVLCLEAAQTMPPPANTEPLFAWA